MSDAPVVKDVRDSAEHLREKGFKNATAWTIRKLAEQKRLTPIVVGRKFYFSVADLDALAVTKGKRG